MTSKTRISRGDLSLLVLKLTVALSALDAIAIGPVPISWLAAMLPIFAVPVIKWNGRSVPNSLKALIVWAILVQGWSLLCLSGHRCFNTSMPALSTTSYPLFIFLRFMPFFSLIAIIGILRGVSSRHDEFSDFIVRLGTWIALIALYVYAAEIFGLPDIPRTRVGTDGLEVTQVSFSYSFHRALGTFREPSLLASWLMLPLFLSFRSMNWRSVIMGGAVLLSGSMTAFVAIVGGASLSFVYLLMKDGRSKAYLLRAPVILSISVAAAAVIFFIFVDRNGQYTGLLGVISERLTPVMESGIEVSNRGYVFEFLDYLGVPFIGYGLGNINLLLTDWMGGSAVSGMLSLYINIILSLGVLGFLLLVIFLAKPFFQDLSAVSTRMAYGLYAAYFGWLIAFIIHSEEFPIMFSFVYGLVFSLGKVRSSEQPHSAAGQFSGYLKSQ